MWEGVALYAESVKSKEATMKYTDFGRTGFQASVINFGAAGISGEGAGYGFGMVTEKEAQAAVEFALEAGINLFDTAPIYGFGESERRLGKFLKSKREEVFIVSKSGITWHENKRVDMNNDPKVAQKMLDQTLKDIDSDYIDLYMVHWPDENHDIRKTLEVHAKAQREGKVKHIGLCNTDPSDYIKAKEVCDIQVLQSEHNIFNPYNLQKLSDFIARDKLAFMSWGTFDKGVLTGSVGKNQKYDPYDCRGSAPWWKQSVVNQKVEVADKILEKLNESGHSLMEFALAYNFSDEHLTTALCGGKKVAQWEGILKALDNLPSDELVKEIEAEVRGDIKAIL
jgi:myo-inositol catabolism protein IolS